MEKSSERRSIHIDHERGYESNYYLMMAPIELENREIASYSRYLGFRSRDDLERFCGTFSSEGELKKYLEEYFYETKREQVLREIDKEYTVRAYYLYEPSKEVKIKYRKRIKDEVYK